MWLLIVSVIFSLAIGYKITHTIYAKQIELTEYNELYKCNRCGKFHRKYQEIVLTKIDPNYTESTCPICHSQSSVYFGNEYDWMKTNPESPRIRFRQLHQLKKAIKTVEATKKEDESIETFLNYYHFLPERKTK
ncbi:hypothetical protein [Fervidibacillus albus]|uniref:Uncharacterized protein n=1 Tax=Fervidibacillus albus TaxID=2980026 RepID=A0A9E8LTP6_9BACI|nr:hypothetical protein [Fervidibacillus albus]WAA08619.1 hypothetical protein OE104_08155 [Fervidibacillus albus]